MVMPSSKSKTTILNQNDIIIRKEDFVYHKSISIIQDYTFGKTVGEGQYAIVRNATHKTTNQVRAIKIIKHTDQPIDQVNLEVSILSRLSHPNIMHIYEFYKDTTDYYIVTEYCKGGDLFEIANERGPFTEIIAANIIRQTLSAICYAHKNKVVHRDLRPENIMFDEKGKDYIIKIIDWGNARYFSDNRKMTSIDGNLYYIAPEVLRGIYDEKCDIWSIGVILYVLLCGYPPFNGLSDNEIMLKVIKGHIDFPKEEWKDISSEAIDLIKKMLDGNPNKRLSAEMCLKQPWFERFKSWVSTRDTAKNAIRNMRKIKTNMKLEQATVSYITNHLISKEEKAELIQLFQDWDLDGNGMLSTVEISTGYQKAFGTVDLNEVETIIENLDSDKNHSIDYHEFLNGTINRDKIITRENLEHAFKAFDISNKGVLTFESIEKLFIGGNTYKINRKIYEEIVKRSEGEGEAEGGDGNDVKGEVITFTGFKKIMMQFYT